MSVPRLTDTGCAECNRRELAVHTAQLELQHKDVVIAELQRKLAEAEAALKQKKGKAKDEPVSVSLVGSDDEWR